MSDDVEDQKQKKRPTVLEEELNVDVDQLTHVRGRISRAPRNVFSLRIGAEELDLIAEAAEERRLTVGDFIRQAALKEATLTAGDNTNSAKIDEILKLVRNLAP